MQPEDGFNSNGSNNSQRVEKRLERLEGAVKNLVDKNGSLDRAMKNLVDNLICGGCHDKMEDKICPSCKMLIKIAGLFSSNKVFGSIILNFLLQKYLETGDSLREEQEAERFSRYH